MRTKFIAAVVTVGTAVLAGGPAAPLASAQTPATYSVVVDGTRLANTMAELHQGQLMVSLRPFVEALGGDVTWNGASRRAVVSYNGLQEVAFWVGSRTAYQNGSMLNTPVAPYIKQDRSMVPAWWLAVRMGAQVRFSGSTLYVDTGSPAPDLVRGQRSAHPLMNSDYYFPLPKGVAYDKYFDSWGDPRSYQGSSFRHEGTDIIAKRGTPLVAVASGTVVRYGWNTLGGYRLTIQLNDAPEYRFYYAHLDRYAPGLYQGARVKAGQLLGYIGSTGEGPEGTRGKFVDHLHFGIYGPDGAVNPYPFLKVWEANKAAR